MNRIAPAITRAAWVQRVAEGYAAVLDADELCELACERDPAGPLATINGLLNALLLRHADDAVTTAALVALQTCHVPDLIELQGE